MRVLIVDDHPVYAEGLVNLLKSRSYSEIACAPNARQGLSLVESFRPDVILMDINMPGMDGIDATRHIKQLHPEIKIIMLTSMEENEALFRAINAGASGYLLKNLTGDELSRSLQDIAAGKNVFSSGLGDILIDQFRKDYALSHEEQDPGVHGRQREVLIGVAQGKTYKEIGRELFISERTVKFHVGRIKELLGLDTKDQLYAWALTHGLI